MCVEGSYSKPVSDRMHQNLHGDQGERLSGSPLCVEDGLEKTVSSVTPRFVVDGFVLVTAPGREFRADRDDHKIRAKPWKRLMAMPKARAPQRPGRTLLALG